MTRFLAIITGMAGSAGLLSGALAFQYLGGLPPCALCYWQRYPHVVAVVLGVLALILPGRFWPALGGIAVLTTAGIGAYHAGVERGYWDGPTSCRSGAVTGLSPEQLMQQIMAAPLVRCDDIVWSLFGLSMAGWNALFSLGLVCVWFLAMIRTDDGCNPRRLPR